jgi:23S rRNA (guanosine2251-2'-O)-methyltransferase
MLSEVIYGINPVIEVLGSRATRVKKIILAREKEQKGIKDLVSLARRHRVPVEHRQKRMLTQIAGNSHHQGVVALMSQLKRAELEDVIESWKQSGENLLGVILDGIQDPQNLGALIRSACACGAHGVVTAKDRAASVTGAVYKTSAGAVEHINVVQVPNIAVAIDYFKQKGAWIVGTSADGTASIYDLDGTLDLMVVIGSEGKGIRPLIREKCDFCVHIPLRGKIPSLNASAAGAVALYEIVRQRHHQREKGVS